MISGGKTPVSEIDLFVSKTRSPKTTAKLIRTTCMAGADPGFFLGGGALVSLNTNKPDSFFFLQNTSCIRKRQVIPGGGGCAPPAPSP